MRATSKTAFAAIAAAASAAAMAWFAVLPALAQGGGESIYLVKCAACHKTGLLNAPKVGVAEDWAPRTAQGRDTLIKHAIEGIRQMPPRGGNPALSDADVASVVDYMLAQLPAPGAAQAAAPAPAAPSGAPATTAAPPAPAPAPAPTPKAIAVAPPVTSGANAFNRLMKPPSKRNPPPTSDGIHDPDNEGTKILQSPRDAFSNLPKATSGNRVDWVAALKDKQINPRNDRVDPNAKPVIMDLNIVREVKGSMPNVVYPHEAHTQWLDCSNCHPAIFIPQKGANQISMAGILLGKQCGVCHGKVAFPVSECRRCHSGNKPSSASQ